MIPLYGFLEGDSLGLLIFAYPDDTVAELAERLQRAARTRVERRERVRVFYRGNELAPGLKLGKVGVEPLERFDVVGA